MPRPTPPVNVAMDGQAAIADARRRCLPMLEAAVASGNWSAMAEAKAIATTFGALRTQARRLTGFLDRAACADGIRRPGHGVAA
jgi:hypothetical protein